ncbi:MAG: hypothetical protein J6J55_02025, partial [Paludibacteraceae bacterium]|nr:hypothetical protein [Paludibacteraceae bacterium]
NKNIKARDAAMGRIQDEELRNNLKSVMSLDSIEEMSQAMVDLHIGDLSPDQAAAALEYVSNATLVKVATGEMMEDQRMAQMAGLTNILPKLTYKGKDGSLTTDELIEVTDKKGRKLYVVAGDVNNTSDTSMLKCATFDSEGNVVTESLLASEVIGINRSTMDAQWVGAYERIFGAELAVGRLQEIEGARRSMENPSGEVVRAHYLRNGLKVYNTGEEVTLVDGRTATVETLLDNGHYLVRSMNPETQQEEMVDIPFMQVLQPENAMAEAQKKMYADSLNKVAEDIVEEEVTEQSEGMQEEAEEQIDAIEEQIEEMPQQVPTREDGKVDYNAIDDPKLYAAQFAKDMGDEATAKKRVGVMAQQARAQAEKLRAKSETLTDANEIIDTNAKADALEAKADFYDKVAAEYTAKEKKSKKEVFKSGDAVEYEGRIAEVVAPEGNDVMIRDDRGNYMVVPPTALTRVAEVPTTEVEPEMQEDESLIAETESGLVQNVFGKLLDKRTARIIDAMAKALGLKVVFVERVRTQAGTFANADIQGNVVRMSWSQRGKAISFLAGHEFLHRMKDMSEEAYNEFKQSVIEHLGEEEWKRRVDAMRANYEAHNAIAQRTGKQLLTYDDALLEEEIVADFAGYLAHTHHAFDIYLQRQEQQKTQKFNLFRWLRDVFAYLRDWYRRFGARTEAQRMTEMVDKLNATIDRAIADAKKNGVNLSNEQKYSISATEMAEIEAERKSIIEKTKANGTWLNAPNGQPTNLTPKQWVEVRTKRFKAWFGDWEKAARIERLRKSESVAITGEEFEITDDFKQNKKNALKYSQSFSGVEYINADTGAKIGIFRGRHNGGVNEVLQHNYKDVPHIQSIAAIPQIIEKSIYIESQPNNDPDTNPDVTEYQCYVCGLNIGSEEYTVLAKVAVDKNGNRYYDHNLTAVAKGKLIDIANNEQSAVTSGFGTTPDTESTTNSQRKYRELISILQTNSSKIVDANGEPKIVEHSTWNEDFYTFDIEHLGESSGDEGVYGAGFYFGNVGETELYGDRAIQAYLNLHNPLVLSDAPIKGFFDYLVENFDKEGLRDIVVKQGNKTATMGDVLDAIKAVNEAHARGEYAELIEQMSQYWYPAEERVLEQQIFRKMGLAIYPTLEPFIQYNVGRKEFSKTLRNAGYDGVVYDNQEYVVFNPNQIKSATENIGTYDANNPDIRFSLIGEIGAANLDRVEEAATRLDNLAIAREMETAGKDAMAIKMATGWERGADGLWRYEIMEEFPNDMVKRLEESVDKKISLRDLLGDSPILLAYPQLADIPIYVVYNPDSNLFGGYSANNDTITLNVALASSENVSLDETLVHEIQHAIQKIEGFSYGSNLFIVDGDAEARTAIREVADLQFRIGDAIGKHVVIDGKADYMVYHDDLVEYVKNNTFTKAEREALELLLEGGDMKVRDMPRIMAPAKEKYEEKDSKASFDQYNRVMGEVEARNTSTRLGMTPEQRRATLLAETEDVAREDQIYMNILADEDTPIEIIGLAMGAQSEARYSLSEVNDRFNEELATLTEENKDKVNLSLGMPSDILLAAGVVNKPMKLYGAKVI